MCAGGAGLKLIGLVAELVSTALANKDNLEALLERAAELMVLMHRSCTCKRPIIFHGCYYHSSLFYILTSFPIKLPKRVAEPMVIGSTVPPISFEYTSHSTGASIKCTTL